jgi:hypothetical protein
MSQSVVITISGSKEEQSKFVGLLPVLKNVEIIKGDTLAVVYLDDMELLAHRLRKYNTIDNNSEERKALASEHVIRLHSQSMNCSRIANWLNEHQYKTSRGKRFHSSQVKRLIDESIQLG